MGYFWGKDSYKLTQEYLVVINVFHLYVKASLKGVRVLSRRPTFLLEIREASYRQSISGQTLKWRAIVNKLLYPSLLVLKPRGEQLETILIADWNSGNTQRTSFILLKQKLASDYTSRKKSPQNRIPFFILTPLIRYHKWGRVLARLHILELQEGRGKRKIIFPEETRNNFDIYFFFYKGIVLESHCKQKIYIS